MLEIAPTFFASLERREVIKQPEESLMGSLQSVSDNDYPQNIQDLIHFLSILELAELESQRNLSAKDNQGESVGGFIFPLFLGVAQESSFSGRQVFAAMVL